MNLNAQILLGDSELDITDYVISIVRDWSLCNCLQSFDIVLDPTVIDFLPGGFELKPSLKCIIFEFGKKVFTGRVNTVKFQRKPEPLIEIQGTDNYKFAKDYFIDEDLGTSNGETVAYWIGQLMDLCGLSYTITSSEPFSLTVAPGIEFNLKSVEEAMNEILAYSFSYAFAGTGGTITIANGARDSDIHFESGPTTTYDDTDPTIIGGGNVKRATHQLNDANTRNVVKVWGWAGTNPFFHSTDNPYIQAVSYGNDLPVNKTVLYSSSLIQDYGTAKSLADRIVSETGHFDSIKTVECIGNPDIKIGYKAHLNINMESATITGSGRITTIHSSMDKDGYNMLVKMDEFCPKFAAWATTQPPQIFYAGTTKLGVYKSTDGGVNWFEYNNGFPTTSKHVTSIAATGDDETMAIMNGQLWYTTSSGLTIPNPLWERRYLPAPNNEAGDAEPVTYGSLITVASDGTTGQFNVLTSAARTHFVASGIGTNYGQSEQVYRSWVYDTINTGNTWGSTQIKYVDDFDRTLYSFNGIHLSNRYGTPYVTANSGYEFYNGLWIYKPPLPQTCYFIDYTNPVIIEANRVDLPDHGFDFGVKYWDFARLPDGRPRILKAGLPGNRVLMLEIFIPNFTGFTYGTLNFENPPYPLNYASTRIDFLMDIGIGDVIIYDYQPRLEGLVDFDPPGINIVANASTNFYSFFVVCYESTIGNPSFWLKFSFRSVSQVALNNIGAYQWTCYSGEERIPGFDYDAYPWDYWSLGDFSSRPSSIYPVYLGAGWIKINLDEIENNL